MGRNSPRRRRFSRSWIASRLKRCIEPSAGGNVLLAGLPRLIAKLHWPWPGGTDHSARALSLSVPEDRLRLRPDNAKRSLPTVARHPGQSINPSMWENRLRFYRTNAGDNRRRQGGITKTGNSHVRRVLVEATWAYRFPVRKTAHLRRKAAAAPPRIQDLAWAAQKRLCARYRRLSNAGKAHCQVTTAVARELTGFLWAIACEMAGKPHNSRAMA